MLYASSWRTLFVLGVSLFGLLGAVPNILPGYVLDKFPTWLPKYRVALGLDLQGGSHLLLEIDRDALMVEQHEALLSSLRKSFRKANLNYHHLKAGRKSVTFSLGDQDKEKLSDLLKAFPFPLQWEKKDGLFFVYFSSGFEESIVQRAVTKSIETVRQRVDERGTREPVIQSQGSGRILLQLPGVSDPAHVKRLLGKTAKLSFQIVEAALSSATPEAERPTISGVEFLLGDQERTLYAVRKEVLVSGETLVDARPTFDEEGGPQVFFSFNAQGGEHLARATQENVGRPFAIVLDREVISAPVIRTPILDGSGVIQGRFTLQEAQDLALLMRSGALPAPLLVLEEKTVGPGLGADSIVFGVRASCIAVIAVMFFMFAIYSFFGIFASIALFFNITLLITCLSLLGATLTLPGIAGIALTMGMAVDANILVNERIREELRRGQKVLYAVEAGYQKAMATIIDSNITTLIGSFALFLLGTGPVRGFALTLALGVLISLFTAIGLTRVLVTFWLLKRRPASLPL